MMGPTGFKSPRAVMDFREGGASLVCMRAPEDYGVDDMYSMWSYEKIVPMQKIEFVQHFTNEHGTAVEPASLAIPPGVPRAVRQVITFNAIDANKTEMTVTKYGYTLEEARNLSQTGLEQCLDKMAVVVQ